MEFRSDPETCFAIAKDDKFLDADDWLYGNANGKLTDDPEKAYTSPRKDMLSYMLIEYENRLSGFRVVEIVETVVRTYKVI